MIGADVNKDGAVDVVASFDPNNSGTHFLVWFENPRGHGGIQLPTLGSCIRSVPGAGENQLLLADIDGDGKMDLVTSSFIYFQNSPSSWAAVQYNSAFRGVALLDIGSGKGRINLVSTGPSPYNAVWFENPRESGGNARTGRWLMHTIGPAYSCGASNCPNGPDVGLQYGRLERAWTDGRGRRPVGRRGKSSTTSRRSLLGTKRRRIGDKMHLSKHVVDQNFIDSHAIRVADMDRNGTLNLSLQQQYQASALPACIHFLQPRARKLHPAGDLQR